MVVWVSGGGSGGGVSLHSVLLTPTAYRHEWVFARWVTGTGIEFIITTVN